jgi:hypothetical protein
MTKSDRSTLLDTTLFAPASPSTSELRALFNGRVIAPDDPRYESARTVVYGGIDRRPAAIVRVADAGDVSRLVTLARTWIRTGDPQWRSQRRGSQHNRRRHRARSFCMKDLQINLEERTAWAETGLTAGEFTAAVGAHGLAVGFGDTGSLDSAASRSAAGSVSSSANTG